MAIGLLRDTSMQGVFFIDKDQRGTRSWILARHCVCWMIPVVAFCLLDGPFQFHLGPVGFGYQSFVGRLSSNSCNSPRPGVRLIKV